jgi:hypothetical protein
VARFTAARRGRLLGLLGAGHTMEKACADVGVTRATVTKWVARGRAGDPEAIEFATCLDVLREEPPQTGRLEAHDVIGLLELQARKGSIRAMLLLLERPWEKNDQPEDPAASAEPEDEFEDLEQDELAPRRRSKRRT